MEFLPPLDFGIKWSLVNGDEANEKQYAQLFCNMGEIKVLNLLANESRKPVFFFTLG